MNDREKRHLIINIIAIILAVIAIALAVIGRLYE